MSTKLEVFDYPKLIAQLEKFQANLGKTIDQLPTKSENLVVQKSQFDDNVSTFKAIYNQSNIYRVLSSIPVAHDKITDPKIQEIIEMEDEKLLDNANAIKFILSVEIIIRKLKELDSFKSTQCDLFHSYKECWKEIKKVTV